MTQRLTISEYKALPGKKSGGANRLTKAIIAYLNLNGCKVWRQNNTAVYDKKIDGYRKFNGQPGISDVIGYHRKTGTFIAIEVKTGKDKLSPDQIQFLKGVNKAGGIGLEARNFDQFEQDIKKRL